MYGITCYNGNGDSHLIGNMGSIIQLANILENKKIKFHVSSTEGFRLSQNSMGCGGFKFWTNAI